MVGQVVSHYRLLSKLGEGGMGVVYRAHDLRLGREVALKFLAADLARDRLAVDRFESEARLAASISHPNICTVHEVDKWSGSPFIVMELISGRTLKEVIADGPLPLEQLIKFAINIADGLDFAHSLGILHRDLTSSNIVLMASGQIKILDFGLAKSMAVTQASKLPAHAMVTMAMGETTTPGVAFGTPSYMSPEQARGESLDTRSDLFSLGVVLYEMATGRLPFPGTAPTLILAALLRDAPEPVLKLRPDLPARLAGIISEALEKERDVRTQSAADMRANLRRVARDLESGRTVLTNQAATYQRGVRVRIGFVLACVLFSVVAVCALAWWNWSARPQPFEARDVTTITNRGKVTRAALSPDGKYVTYISAEKAKEEYESVWVRQVDRLGEHRLTTPTAQEFLGITFSPDTRDIFYVATRPEASWMADVYRISIFGGMPERVITHVDSNVSFSPDGHQFAFIRDCPAKTAGAAQTRLMITDADGRNERVIASLKAPAQFATREGGAAWSPDGKRIAAVVRRQASWYVDLFNTTTGAARTLRSEKPWLRIDSLSWSPAGDSLYLAAIVERGKTPALWDVAVPSGKARCVLQTLGFLSNITVTANGKSVAAVQTEYNSGIWVEGKKIASHQVSHEATGFTRAPAWMPDGRLLYTSVFNGQWATVAVNDSDGSRETIMQGRQLDSTAVCGDQLAFVEYGNDGSSTVWRSDFHGENALKLATAGSRLTKVSCTPDRRWVFFDAPQPGRNSIIKVASDGKQQSQFTSYFAGSPSVSRDGARVVCWYKDAVGDTRLGVFPINGGEPLWSMQPPPGLKGGRFKFTPDGRGIAMIMHVAGVWNVWSFPLNDHPPTQLTQFHDEARLIDFDISPTNWLVATERSLTTSDVMLIRSDEPER